MPTSRLRFAPRPSPNATRYAAAVTCATGCTPRPRRSIRRAARQPAAMCIALANRSVLFAELGHHESALTDSRRARDMAIELGMRREQLIATVGEVIARWHSSLDVTVLSLIDDDEVAGRGSRRRRLSAAACSRSRSTCCGAWDATTRRVSRCSRTSSDFTSCCKRRTAERWDNVRAGVDRLRHSCAGEADELTGLPNRQFLGRWLPDALTGRFAGVHRRAEHRQLRFRQRIGSGTKPATACSKKSPQCSSACAGEVTRWFER